MRRGRIQINDCGRRGRRCRSSGSGGYGGEGVHLEGREGYATCFESVYYVTYEGEIFCDSDMLVLFAWNYGAMIDDVREGKSY